MDTMIAHSRRIEGLGSHYARPTIRGLGHVPPLGMSPTKTGWIFTGLGATSGLAAVLVANAKNTSLLETVALLLGPIALTGLGLMGLLAGPDPRVVVLRQNAEALRQSADMLENSGQTSQAANLRSQAASMMDVADKIERGE